MMQQSPTNARSISKRKRFAVLDRDGYKCVYCGQSPPHVRLVIDHIRPVAKGGSNDISNLATACEACNQGKHDKLIWQLRSKPNAGPAYELPKAQSRVDMDHLNRVFHSMAEGLGWFWYNSMDRRQEYDLTFNEGRIRTILRFMKVLDLDEIKHYMTMAIGRIECYPNDDADAWRYFCGICWNVIKDTKHGT